MQLSQLFTHTLRENPKDEVTANARLLTRGGFIYKNSAGIYSYLPLGWRVMQKIATIVREEMNAIGGQELLMQALVDKSYMEPTGRWNIDVAYKAKADDEKEPNFALGWTHEEVLSAIAQKFVHSYKDLPFSAYQIQTKFRNEPRAKSGILRGREFMMKDLYSYHTSEEDFKHFYEQVAEAYHKIFKRCGLKAIYTLAAGGVFTKSHTHEFQVIAEAGEDTIYVCAKCGYALNKEVVNDVISRISPMAGDEKSHDDGISPLRQTQGRDDNYKCPKCNDTMNEHRSIEVGNIFPQGTRYSEALNLYYTDELGNKKLVVQGSYGIGIGRVMGTVVEVHHDDKGILWPENIAPYQVHLIQIPNSKLQTPNKSQAPNPKSQTEKIYEQLTKAGIEVLYDDREDVSAGEKFADADLIGCPIRVVVSERTIEKESVEMKRRDGEVVKMIEIDRLISQLIG